jgi:hypothetical protein
MLARIYKPAPTAMQSGKAASTGWVLEYAPEDAPKSDPLIGYTSSTDMRRQLRLRFATFEEAVAYAGRNGIPYEAAPNNQPETKKLSYSDNFRFGRPQPWTH